jgi:methyl-accepting chemotaxis protein
MRHHFIRSPGCLWAFNRQNMISPHDISAPQPALALTPQVQAPLIGPRLWSAMGAAWVPCAMACSASLGAAGVAEQPLGWIGAGVLCGLIAAACRWSAQRMARRDASATARAGEHTVDSLGQLDSLMLQQLGRAVTLSETAGLNMIQRVCDLRSLSARLMDYLGSAQSQSAKMQTEIERSGAIVAELANFVQQLPQQIAAERAYLEQLVGEVRHLSGITDTIRGMARQTEILSINAAIAAAQAGEAGRGFAVLAGEVRRLAVQSNDAAQSIESHIRQLVGTVQAHTGGEAAERLRNNEAEAARLLGLTGKLDEGYLDMRQFYAMLLTAITEHNGALDNDITGLLDTAQYQDVIKQIVDRLQPAFTDRHALLQSLLSELQLQHVISSSTHLQARALVHDYQRAEAAHSDPDAPAMAVAGAGADAGAGPGADGRSQAAPAAGPPLARIELF